MEKTRLAYLFGRYVHDQCTTDEKAELMVLVELPENEAAVKRLIDEVLETDWIEERIDDEVASYILNRIVGEEVSPLFKRKGRIVKLKTWVEVAAAVTVLILATYWFSDNKRPVSRMAETKKEQQNLILPGGEHAMLALSDGSIVLLDSLKSGEWMRNGFDMHKENGVLNYRGNRFREPKIFSWNLLKTPRGGQYKVILPDKSEVWLNASSSLYFPDNFNNKERVVKIIGEAYFEVTKDVRRPFKVEVGEMQVRVLGTHFNVSAYPDESEIKTSLLEGRVEISDGQASGLLKPGQQGVVVKKAHKEVKIKNVDMDEVVAWKNGLFVFNGADIVTIMNQIGRWYDVDVSFEGKMPQRSFEGKIRRDAPLADVLKILKLSGIKFKVSGKTIIVD